jgi:hypothetical protein
MLELHRVSIECLRFSAKIYQRLKLWGLSRDAAAGFINEKPQLKF